MTAYCQLVNYRRKAYATDESIAEAKSNIMSYRQRRNVCAARYS